MANQTHSGFRKFQLCVMGFIAILIGPLSLFTASVTHGLPFLQSISEAGTIANRASPILPYCLGALALFSLTYAIQHGYDESDRIFTVGMFAGFTAVAMQMCLSPYVEQSRVGLLGLSPGASNIVHDAGAIVGFGSMILWILLCFRRSGVPPAEQTARKRLRNRLYIVLAAGMLASLSLFALDRAGLFGDGFPVLFAAECQMLTFGGLACMTKGGLILADRGTRAAGSRR